MKKTNNKKKMLIVTDKQLQVIKEACELYGRIQLGQFERFAEIVTQTGFAGWQLRVQPKRFENETDEKYQVRCDREEEIDMSICRCFKGVLDGMYRDVYNYGGKPRPNEANVALDIWAALDRRRDDGFHMGSEPLPELKELTND